LRSLILRRQKGICLERALIVTASYRETEGEPMAVRRARAFQRICQEMSISIKPDELVVGQHASQPGLVPLFPETGARWIREGLLAGDERFACLSGQQRDELAGLLSYWEGKTVHDRVLETVPAEAKRLLEATHPPFSLWLFVRNAVGHICADYGWVIRTGLVAIRTMARNRLAELELAEVDAGREFYRAVEMCCNGLMALADRYADLAEALAKQAEDERRRKELQKIAAVCRRVPAYPARDFHEALQFFWFLQLGLHLETDGLAESPGRFDQYMYPYYRASLEAGDSEEGLQELLDCLWVKFNEVDKLPDTPAGRGGVGVTMSQNLLVGGIDEEGRDATNPLSFACLRADRHVHMPQPALSARLHRGSPTDLLLECAKNIKAGGGKPALFNDEAIVASLLATGVPLEKARAYVIIGCVEPVPGDDCYGWTNAGMFNLAKCLEVALNDGKCLLCGEKLGPSTGSPSAWTSFADVQRAYRAQLSYFVKQMVSVLEACDLAHRELLPVPYSSMLMRSCLLSGVDLSQGGARYNYTGPQGVGLADVTDSLAVIKRGVFVDKRFSLDTLLGACSSDFADETFRLRLRNHYPKYGNGEPEVDELARWVALTYCLEAEKYGNARGGRYRPGLYPVAANIPLGKVVAALPSGRRACQPLADGISPEPGCDVNGPTAVLRSAAAIDHLRASNGTLLNLKFHPSVLAKKEDLLKFVDFMRSFVQLGLFHMQINVVNAETLRAAQREPQAYRDLLVRVAGYSAFFVELSQELQDHIIERTEHHGY